MRWIYVPSDCCSTKVLKLRGVGLIKPYLCNYLGNYDQYIALHFPSIAVETIDPNHEKDICTVHLLQYKSIETNYSDDYICLYVICICYMLCIQSDHNNQYVAIHCPSIAVETIDAITIDICTVHLLQYKSA